jgi:hypothetical protein
MESFTWVEPVVPKGEEMPCASVSTYQFEPLSDGTKVTESYAYEPMRGFKGFLYGTIFQRELALKTGMRNTLIRLKNALEGGAVRT